MITKKEEAVERSCRHADLVLCAANEQPEISICCRYLTSLIRDQGALIIGPIRQEILSGYSDLGKFRVLKEKRSHYRKILPIRLYELN